MAIHVRVSRRKEWDQKARRERWVYHVELVYPPTANGCLAALEHEALRRAQRIWHWRRSTSVDQMNLFTFPWQQVGEDIIELVLQRSVKGSMNA